MKHLLPTIQLTHDMCHCVIAMETNGMKIDVLELKRLDTEYENLYNKLHDEMLEMVKEVMGDTEINLNSPQQVSILLYSRMVKDKKTWKDYFEANRRMSHTTFKKAVNAFTSIIHKTRKYICPSCAGAGAVPRTDKYGNETARQVRCSECGGESVIYKNLQDIAGFKLIPSNISDITALGFTTKKDKLEQLAGGASDPARTFLKKMVQHNAISHYRSHFINGIKRGVRGNDFLYPQVMQHATRTGRLSSRAPNLHNQPRGDKCSYCEGAGCQFCLSSGYQFPIRRVFISRWEGGKITEGDYSQLEFRVAADLSGCEVAKQDILDGVDVHAYTAKVLSDAGQATGRQGAKSHTFKPLYGGRSGTPAEQAYYRGFIEKYTGIADWHESLCSTAIRDKAITIPSGRTYAFPTARRYPSGGVTESTKIKNYPVQGFATGDIVPCSTVKISYNLAQYNFKSLLINEVHDSNVLDTHPDETKSIPIMLYDTMMNVNDELERRYGYRMSIPVAVEIKQGPNWLEMKNVI